MPDATRADDRPGRLPSSPLDGPPMHPEELRALTLAGVWMLADAHLSPNALQVALAVLRLSLAEGLAGAVAGRETLSLVSGVPAQHVHVAVGELRAAGILFLDGGERAHVKRYALLLVRERWRRQIGEHAAPLPNRSGLGPVALAAHVAESAATQRGSEQTAFDFPPSPVPDPAAATHPPNEDGRRAAAAVSAGNHSPAVPRQATPAAPTSTAPRPVAGSPFRAIRETVSAASPRGVIHRPPAGAGRAAGNRSENGRNPGGAQKIAHNPGENSGPREKSPTFRAISGGSAGPALACALETSQFQSQSFEPTALSPQFQSVAEGSAGELETDGRGPGGTEPEGRSVGAGTVAEILVELTAAVGPVIMAGAEKFWGEAIAHCPLAAREAAGQTKLAGRQRGGIRKHPGGFMHRCYLEACEQLGRPASARLRDWWRKKGGPGRA